MDKLLCLEQKPTSLSLYFLWSLVTFTNLRTSLKIHIEEGIQRNSLQAVLMAQLQRSNRENTYLWPFLKTSLEPQT